VNDLGGFGPISDSHLHFLGLGKLEFKISSGCVLHCSREVNPFRAYILQSINFGYMPIPASRAEGIQINRLPVT
jgi:hypothetical protein